MRADARRLAGRRGGGLNESFTVRKISYGEGVERVFPIYSPMVEKVEIVRRGKVRRAKLYYLRDRRGKSARIAEKAESATDKAARVEAKAAVWACVARAPVDAGVAAVGAQGRRDREPGHRADVDQIEDHGRRQAGRER